MTSSFLPYLLGNFLTQCAAQYVLVSRNLTVPAEENGFVTHAMLYMLVSAFLMLPLGLISDRHKSNGRIFAAAGCLFSALGTALSAWIPEIACILNGFGSALFLSGGMTDALTQGGGLSRVGIFLSFGFPGAALGIKLGNFPKFPGFYGIVLLCFTAVLLLYFCRHPRETAALPESKPLGKLPLPILRIRPVTALFLFLTVFAAVFAGSAAPAPETTFRFAWLVPACACFAGLFLGGIFSDLFGAVFLSAPCLLVSGVLFAVGKTRFLLYAAALFFLCVCLPAAVASLADFLRGHEGIAAGLAAVAALAAHLSALWLTRDGVALPAAVIPVSCVIAAFLTAAATGRNLYRPASQK